MPTSADPGSPIVPIAQPMEVDGPEVSGRAIALQFTGNGLLYLIVNRKEEGPPVWIAENELTSTFMSDSRR